MRIGNDGELQVYAPHRTPRSKIDKIITEHESWIEKKSSEVKDLPRPLKPHSYTSGDEFLLLGKRVQLRVERAPEESVSIEGNELRVKGKSVSKKNVQYMINRFYDSYGKEIYSPYVYHYLEVLGIPPAGVQICMAGYPKRLGSCSRDRVLTFSRRSLMLPENLIEYVALHEVAHLVYFNHSKRFKDLLSRHMADYRDRVEEIKKLRIQISHL